MKPSANAASAKNKSNLNTRIMKKLLSAAFCLLLSLTAQAQTPKWASQARKAIISIVTYDKDNKIMNTGNGFFVKADGTAVSDYGLFEGAQRAVVIDSDGKEFPVDCILGANAMYDVVKFRIQTDKEVDALTLANTPAAVGSTVFLLPYASQKDVTPARGTVDACTQVEGKYHYYTLHLQTSDKTVSCPITNAEGQVLGMIQKSADADAANSYAIDAAFASDLTLNALSRVDHALNSIGIRKGLPDKEDDAQVYLLMSAGLPEADYLALINDYIRQFPTSHEGYLRRATFYMDKKDDEHNKLAEADITRALEVSTRKDDAYYNACKLVYQAVANGLQYPDWTLQRAMQLIEEAIKLRPLPLYVQTQGDLYFGMKDYAKAYECYDRVNHSELRSAESLFSAARTKQVMGANDEALALMDSTVAFFGPLLTEKAAPYVFQRAQMKASIGKYREAVADYNEYERLVLGKANAEFFFIREQAEMQCRLYQQALDDIEKAVEMDPKQVAYIIEQVALYTRFSQFDKAVEAARRGIELAPDNANLYRMMGFGQIQLKQKEAGRQNLLKAKELGDPNAATLLEKYGK